MASRDSDFELSADSLSIHDDTGHVTAATEPHSSRHNTHANFMVALQQGSNAPVTKDAPFQHVDPRFLNMAMASVEHSTSGGADRTGNSRSARHAPYHPGPSSITSHYTSAFSVLSTLYSTVIGGSSQPSPVSTSIPAPVPNVTTIGQAAHYSRNPVLFQEFRKMMGHFLLSQLIQFGTILLQDKRADIATRLLTFPSIMGVLLAQANLRDFNINPLEPGNVTAAITSGRKLLMDRAVSYVNTIFSIDDPAPGDHIASDDYINYVHNMTSSIVDGSFFHLPEGTVGPRLFRNRQFWNAMLGVFYRSDNRCLAAKFPRVFVTGITIQSIAAFGTAVVHRAHCIEAKKLGESVPKFKSATYEGIYKGFLTQLDAELLAPTKFKDFLVAMMVEGSALLPRSRPTFAIY